MIHYIILDLFLFFQKVAAIIAAAHMSELALDIREELFKLPGNGICAECPTKGPQWASVNMGVLFCLSEYLRLSTAMIMQVYRVSTDCSGQHRGLGVHISFVRSLKMDSWTEEQIASMRNGGNKKLNDALLAAGVPADADISAKYNNNVAEAYRVKFKAELAGDAEAAAAELPSYEAPRYAGQLAFVDACVHIIAQYVYACVFLCAVPFPTTIAALPSLFWPFCWFSVW